MSDRPIDQLCQELSAIPRLHELACKVAEDLDEIEAADNFAIADDSSYQLDELLECLADVCRGVRGLDELFDLARLYGEIPA